MAVAYWGQQATKARWIQLLALQSLSLSFVCRPISILFVLYVSYVRGRFMYNSSIPRIVNGTTGCSCYVLPPLALAGNQQVPTKYARTTVSHQVF